jgi:endoglucanase
MKNMKKLIDKLRNASNLNKTIAVVIGLSVAVGGYTLFTSNAAGPSSSVEAEIGTLAGSAKVINDVSASAGKAIQFGTGIVTPPPSTGAMSVRVSGNKFISKDGKTIRLVGVNFSGQQYACAEGWGMFDAPATDASITALKSWGITAVRVPLNESCWLGINGVATAYAGANYQKAVGDWVKKLNDNGLYVIVDQHMSHNGTVKATDQQAMANRDHANDYWKSVAGYFKNSPAVLFDLYNEPYPDSNKDTTAAWTCVRDGGTCPGVGFVAAGMQEMLNSVRSTGAKNPVMIAGPEYAGSLKRWMEFKPNDPENQLVASVHIYGQPLGSPYDDQSRWTPEITPVAAQVPIVIGEMGDSDCTHRFSDKLMPFADGLGLNYFAWGWATSTCAGEPALITNYNGTPTAYGIGFRDHVKALNLQNQ